jgi:hypothetical protein
MATATAMYHSHKNPLRKVTYKSDSVETVKSPEKRRLHKALLRYHDPNNWPLIRAALKEMGLGQLIGSGEKQLVPANQPRDEDMRGSARRKNAWFRAQEEHRAGAREANSQGEGTVPAYGVAAASKILRFSIESVDTA